MADLLLYIDPNVVDQADRIGHDFVANTPFPHVIIDDFLQTVFAQKLLDDFPDFSRGNSIGDDGREGPKATFAQVAKLGRPYSAFDDLIKSQSFLLLLSRLTRVNDLLYDPFYLGGGTHENRCGASLDAHIDFNYHPTERWHRRLNLLLYLNRNWQAEWGGSLELFRDPREDAVAAICIEPQFNRCVIFETSERSWHGFSQISLPVDKPDITRKSIALYFYTTDRPVDQVAPRHSTVYVPRPLPVTLAAGHVLSAPDIQTLKQLLATRDAQIQMLQAENQRLLQAQEHGFAGQLLYLMKRAYVRFRR